MTLEKGNQTYNGNAVRQNIFKDYVFSLVVNGHFMTICDIRFNKVGNTLQENAYRIRI